METLYIYSIAGGSVHCCSRCVLTAPKLNITANQTHISLPGLPEYSTSVMLVFGVTLTISSRSGCHPYESDELTNLEF